MDKFHDHLDKCKQCEEHPFNLCPLGAMLMLQAVQSLGQDEIKITL